MPVSADITADQLAPIVGFPFVEFDPNCEAAKQRYSTAGRTRIGNWGLIPRGLASFYGASYDQLQTHQIAMGSPARLYRARDYHWCVGYRFSTHPHGLVPHPDDPLNVIAKYDFINDDPNTAPEAGDHPSQHHHGTLILGTMAAYQPETYVGEHYEAAFILCKTEDITDEYPGEEDFYIAGLEFIESNGGDVATSSLTYLDWYTQADMDGQTGVTTIGVNTATDNGIHCCTAVGNSGHDSNPTTSRSGCTGQHVLKVFSVGSVNTSWPNIRF